MAAHAAAVRAAMAAHAATSPVSVAQALAAWELAAPAAWEHVAPAAWAHVALEAWGEEAHEALWAGTKTIFAYKKT